MASEVEIAGSNDDLNPFFIPSLSAVLLSAEDKKGSPLSVEETLQLRDEAACIMMIPADAEKINESRGYRDIDPENCWHDWQMLRRELGRKPDIDPGPRFFSIRSDDPAYLRTIEQAQSTLDRFRSMLPDDRSPLWYASIKTNVVTDEGRSLLWLNDTAYLGDTFSAKFFEVPHTLPKCQVGDTHIVSADAVLDWMLNDNGMIHGGYSLRYQRERMTEAEKQRFDQYIGATGFI